MSVRASNASAAETATNGRKWSPKKVGVLAVVSLAVVGSGVAYYLTRPVAKDPVSFRVGDLDDEFALRGARDALKGKSREDLKKEFNKFKADTDKKIKKDTIITKGTKKVVEAPQVAKDQLAFLDLEGDALQVASEKEKTFEAVKKELSEPNADLEKNFKRFMAEEEAKKAAAKKAAAEKALAEKALAEIKKTLAEAQKALAEAEKKAEQDKMNEQLEGVDFLFEEWEASVATEEAKKAAAEKATAEKVAAEKAEVEKAEAEKALTQKALAEVQKVLAEVGEALAQNPAASSDKKSTADTAATKTGAEVSETDATSPETVATEVSKDVKEAN